MGRLPSGAPDGSLFRSGAGIGKSRRQNGVVDRHALAAKENSPIRGHHFLHLRLLLGLCCTLAPLSVIRAMSAGVTQTEWMSWVLG